MKNWFLQQENPFSEWETYSGFAKDVQWDVHAWARQKWAGAFARGGWTSVAFAPSRKEMWKGITRRVVEKGSREHIRRLTALQKLYPGNEGIKEALSASVKASKIGPRVKSLAFKSLGPLTMLGFAAYAYAAEPGGEFSKGGAAIGSVVGLAGGAVGAKIGTTLGAMAGSVIPGIGTVAGAAVGAVVGMVGGYIAGEEPVKALGGAAQRLVDAEIKKRRLTWGTPNPAFYTRQAATMRQLSLQSMNRGLMTSRSALGQEGMFLHQ